LPLTREQAIRYLKHEAECQGEAFDEASVPEDFVLYRIQGTGAVVREVTRDVEGEAERAEAADARAAGAEADNAEADNTEAVTE
jgi:hypothetical protein